MQITREMLFPLAFYKKAKFNGSKGKLNYRIEKAIEGEQEYLKLSVWKGPECYDVSREEKKTDMYPFSDEGMEQIIAYLNQM